LDAWIVQAEQQLQLGNTNVYVVWTGFPVRISQLNLLITGQKGQGIF